MSVFFGYNAPFREGLQNVLSLQADERLIKNDLLQLLLTAPGERIMRPSFGSPIREFIFESMESSNIETLRSGIEEAIETFEQRVTVSNIEIEVNDDNGIIIKIFGSFDVGNEITSTQSLLVELTIPMRVA